MANERKQRFEMWQASECARLGITKDQHERILELAAEMEAAMGMGGAYEAIVNLIDLPDSTLTAGTNVT